MNDFDAWIFFDGPAPESLRPVLDALRDPLPEDEELELLALMDQLEARLSLPPDGASGPILLDDADVQSAPPTPGAPALPKEERAPEPPPPVTAAGPRLPPVVRSPAFLVETSRSPEAEAEMHAVLVATGFRPAPTVRVASAGEHPRTLELPVMDPSQGARQAVPELSLQDYVAYRTALELWPEHRAYFHQKYKVESEAAYDEVVRRWEGQLAASPPMRAQADAIRASCLEHARTNQWAHSGGA